MISGCISAVRAFTSQLLLTATLAPGSQLKHTRLVALGESLLGVGQPLTSQQREIGQYQYDRTLFGGTRQGTLFPGRNSLSRGFLQEMSMHTAGLGFRSLSTPMSSVQVHPGTPNAKISGERTQKRWEGIFTEFTQKEGELSMKIGLLKKLHLQCAFLYVTKQREAIFTMPGIAFISAGRKRAGPQRARGTWLSQRFSERQQVRGDLQSQESSQRGRPSACSLRRK